MKRTLMALFFAVWAAYAVLGVALVLIDTFLSNDVATHAWPR